MFEGMLWLKEIDGNFYIKEQQSQQHLKKPYN